MTKYDKIYDKNLWPKFQSWIPNNVIKFFTSEITPFGNFLKNHPFWRFQASFNLSFLHLPCQKMCPLACKHRWAACLQLLNVNNPCVWPQHHKAGMAVLVRVWRQWTTIIDGKALEWHPNYWKLWVKLVFALSWAKTSKKETNNCESRTMSVV